MGKVAASPTSRIVVALAMIMALALGTWASVQTGWTTVGSAGTVDDRSASIVGLRGPYVTLKTTCWFAFLGIDTVFCSVATGTVTVRYNVVPTGSLNPVPPAGFTVYQFSTRFRVTGKTQRVLLYLKEVNLQLGTENTILTFDSNAFGASADYQTQTGPRSCGFTLNF